MHAIAVNRKIHKDSLILLRVANEVVVSNNYQSRCWNVYPPIPMKVKRLKHFRTRLCMRAILYEGLFPT